MVKTVFDLNFFVGISSILVLNELKNIFCFRWNLKKFEIQIFSHPPPPPPQLKEIWQIRHFDTSTIFYFHLFTIAPLTFWFERSTIWQKLTVYNYAHFYKNQI